MMLNKLENKDFIKVQTLHPEVPFALSFIQNIPS